MCINKLLFEYRSFGQDFGKAEQLLRELGKNTTPKESYDYYILAETNQLFNVLIRNQQLIIKELVTTIDNLEKWNVNNAEAFPLSKDFIENTFFPAMGIEAPNIDDKPYSIIDFIEEIVNADPDLKIVEVFKRKIEFAYNNCNCEIVENLINGAFIKTFNIESEHTQAVYDTLQKLEIFDKYENINYPLKIKQIIGLVPLKNYKTE